MILFRVILILDSKMASNNLKNSNIYSINQQVEDLKEIMKDNVNKVMERDGSLHDLENRTENLEIHAGQFQTRAVRVKRFFACKNKKWTLIIIIFVLFILFIIAITIGLSIKKN